MPGGARPCPLRRPVADAPDGADDANRLPNWHLAYVAPEKLRDYALNPYHSLGRHKARLFSAVLGYEQSNWAALRTAILAGLPAARARLRRQSADVADYEVVLRVIGPNGHAADVVTGWRIATPVLPDSAPRLTTAYPRTSNR